MSVSSIFNPTKATMAVFGNGFSVPRMSTVDRLSLSFTVMDKGMMVYDTNLAALFLWNGSAWTESAVYQELSSWTPVLTSSTGTFTITVSDRRAFRVGSLVTVSVTFVVDNIGGAPTDAQLSLPTSVANFSALTFGYADSLDAPAKTQLMARVNPATSLVDLFHYDNGTVFDLGPHINVGTELTLAGTYVAT